VLGVAAFAQKLRRARKLLALRELTVPPKIKTCMKSTFRKTPIVLLGLLILAGACIGSEDITFTDPNGKTTQKKGFIFPGQSILKKEDTVGAYSYTSRRTFCYGRFVSTKTSGQVISSGTLEVPSAK
jgi:hypothetical protein